MNCSFFVIQDYVLRVNLGNKTCRYAQAFAWWCILSHTRRTAFFVSKMIDTIRINIPRNDYLVTDYCNFKTNERDLYEIRRGYKKFTNFYAASKKKHLYYPKTDIEQRGLSYDLVIDFSAPKLLFGENVSELVQSNLSELVEKLRKKLSEMGVQVSTEKLLNAMVLAFHPSKNILLGNICPPEYVISAISKAATNNKYLNFKVKYANDGSSHNIYSKPLSMIVYDKNKDMEKHPALSIDGFKPAATEFPNNLLRIEVRICRRDKVVSILQNIGFAGKATLSGIFNTNLCATLVNKFWNDFYKNKSYLIPPPISTMEVYKSLRSQNPDIKMQKTLRMSALHSLMKDKGGPAELKMAISEQFGKDAWYRLRPELEELNNLINYRHRAFAEVERQLARFEPVTLPVV